MSKSSPFLTLEERIQEHAENAVIQFISSSNWLQPDYTKRVTVPHDLIEEAWKLVDRKALIAQLKERIERELADRLINHIAAEMATDIKQILGVPERREAVRALARDHLQAIMAKGLNQ